MHVRLFGESQEGRATIAGWGAGAVNGESTLLCSSVCRSDSCDCREPTSGAIALGTSVRQLRLRFSVGSNMMVNIVGLAVTLPHSCFRFAAKIQLACDALTCNVTRRWLAVLLPKGAVASLHVHRDALCDKAHVHRKRRVDHISIDVDT